MISLNLESIKVEKVESVGDDYHVYGYSKTPTNNCPHCGSNLRYIHGNKTQLIMDIPHGPHRVGIMLERERYKCRNEICKKTFMQTCKDVNEHHRATNRLVKYIAEQAIERPCTDVADEVGLTEKTIRLILGAFIEVLEKKSTIRTPEILGLDEVHLNKKMRLVLTNIGERTIIDLRDNRNQKTVETALYRFKDHKKIRLVTMDMWRPYRTAVYGVLPHSTVIIDKFHVVKMANEAVDKGRKELRDQMEPELFKRLKKDKWLMLSRRSDLSEFNKALLQGWTNDYQELHALYEAKEWLFDIWDSKITRQQAEASYLEWKQSIPSGLKKYFSNLDRAIGNWHKEVFNYFDHRETNAFTESANSLIKDVYRKGRGYSFEVLRAKVLYLHCPHKIVRKPFKQGIPSGVLGFMQMEEFDYGVAVPHKRKKKDES